MGLWKGFRESVRQQLRQVHRGWLWIALALVLTLLLYGTANSASNWMRVNRDRFDVIVVGGEPEGVAAAVAAARSGTWTLLVEPRDGLGGLMTYGMLNSIDMNNAPDGSLVTRGIFQEFYRGVHGDSFDVAEAQQVFDRMVRNERRLVVMQGTEFLGPVLSADGRVIRGIKVQRDGRVQTISGARVIDTTQDADVAAASGVPYTLGAEDRGLKTIMAATLVLHLGGVDWTVLTQAIRDDGDPETGFTRISAWGFKEMKDYKSSSPRIRVRAPNIGLQRDGTVLINAVQIFNVNGLDPAARAEAFALVRAEAPRITDFMRARLPGFANTYLVGTAPELYIRESRHIIGEYQLTINDVLENRDFPDRIGMGSYPVDIQATGPDNWGWAIGRPVMYSVPLRSLIPLKVDNLLVASRSASFTALAAGSARVIPVGMVTGQAAGVAAAYSLKQGITPRQLAGNPDHVGKLQEQLRAQGAYLEPHQSGYPLKDHWAIGAVRVLRPLGVISAGYTNDYQLDQAISPVSFLNLSWEVFKRSGYNQLPGRRDLEKLMGGQTISPSQAVQALQAILEAVGRLEQKTPQIAGATATTGSAGTAGTTNTPASVDASPSWLGAASRAHLMDGAQVTRALAYSLLADVLTAAGQAPAPRDQVAIRADAIPPTAFE